jgi:Family of unknown function (DUF5681)
MNDQKSDFEVGYGKPLVATRFKKGQSGNPSGKPKKIAQKLDPGKILQSIDNEEITVKIDGKEKRIQKGEVYFRQLFNKAIKGSLSDARVASMAARHFGLESEAAGETRFIIVPDKKLTSRKSS